VFENGEEPQTSTIGTSNQSSSVPSTVKKSNVSKRSKLYSLALQLILINGVNILGSVFSILVDTSLKLATSGNNLSLLTDFQYLRPLFRFFFILAQALIPVLSIILTPWNK